jgi:choline dehydrogenase-like flavoprotein
LLPNQVVESLEHDETGSRITGVRTIDSITGERKLHTAKIFFMCASTIGTTQILLNSASELYPNGLANKSGALGKYLMDHLQVLHMGMFVDNTDSYYQGNRPNGLYIPRFRNVGDQDSDADFVRGYGYQCHTFRPEWQMSFNKKGFGVDYKESLTKPMDLWVWATAAFIECLPDESNQVTLHASKKDRFGIPQVVTQFDWDDNTRKLAQDSATQAEKIMRAAGALYYQTGDTENLAKGGSAVHEMGTARMGDDPSKAVLNKHNQAHGIDNLFVTDGSFMTSASCVNPSLTYMAFTARACAYAAEQFKAGKFNA